MEDEAIVSLYWERSEQAINETEQKYGRFCYAIAYNLLHNTEDAAESVNDTYLEAWNSMPPHKPNSLTAFLGRITRRLSVDRWRSTHAEKRGGGEYTLLLTELSECIPSKTSVEQQVESKELAETVNRFLTGLSNEKQQVFLRRYWYGDSMEELAKTFGFTVSKVKSMLFHIRGNLRDHLKKEGF
ncbi:MAG: RNA polymerase sigma factor [Lachnospiraceae bacterium]|nr:RNA polymerase sigma factor [Lachnospiraceae bacterium]